MSENFEPGDVAMITTRDGVRELGFCFQGGPVLGDYGQRARWRVADNEVWSSVTDVRPVAVIDPEDREQVERLGRSVRDVAFKAGDSYPGMGRFADAIQAALREFANPTQSAPTEDGWYAYDGGRQTMIFRLTRGQWYVITDSGQCDPCEWGYISQALGVWNLVRVISEGIS